MRLNAIVIDLAVLGPQGWNYLEQLCARAARARRRRLHRPSTVAQRVRGLRLGADDWLTKPCHPEELIARVEAVVRRRRRAEARVDAGPIVAGELEIRADQFQAFVGGARVELTRREFELIQLLADAEGHVLEREEIYQRVWGYAMAHGDRSVDVFVRKLRQKLEKARRTGATSTPTSASATASRRSRSTRRRSRRRSSRAVALQPVDEARRGAAVGADLSALA